VIKSIKLTNFQRHKESVFEFTPGVNIIYGKTNSGKSSVIRAIRYISENRPTSNKFERNGAKGFAIEIEFDNGVVKRIKSKANKYILNDKELNAVGTDVPEEIRQFLGFNEFSLQGQFDSVKFLNDSPGKVAKYINAITKQEIIEDVTKKINAEVKTITEGKETAEKALLEAEAKLSMLSKLTELNDKKTKIQNKLDEHSDTAKTWTALSVIIDGVNEINRKINLFPDLDKLSKEANRIVDVNNEYRESENKKASLLSLISNLHQTEERLGKLDGTDKLFSKLKEIEGEKYSEEKISETKRKIYLYVKGIESIQPEIDKLDKKIKEDQSLLSEIDICPLCGNKWEQK
jgi:exonuclease SbcC